MSLVSYLRVELIGRVDDHILEILQRELRLEGGGRLTDDWDEEFGDRPLRADESLDSWMTLFREAETKWFVTVAALPELLTSDEVDVLRAEVFAAADKAGLQARTEMPPSKD